MKDTKKIFSTKYGELAIDTVADAKMAKVFAQGDYHQEDTVELLSSFVEPESTFVDGGAHIGTITIPLAHKVAHTIAYEADANTSALLQENVVRNKVSVDVRQKGLGATSAHGTMVDVREGNAGAHTLAVGNGNVEIVTLDDELQGFDTLKLDVEGMELEVLQGATRIIEEAKPVILFEVNLSQLRAHNASLHELASFLHNRQYSFYLPFRLHGELVLGSTLSISLIALFMYPGAYVLHRTSSVFDILALPNGRVASVTTVSVWCTLAHVLGENLRDKMRRMRRYFL